MTRPRDWTPLCADDPVPGDPEAVARHARHYRDVATELRQQVARLQRIGADGTLRGRYAERLQEAAGDLVKDLGQVEDRYSEVAAALRVWAPELQAAQDDADELRTAAVLLDEERQRLSGSAAARRPDDLEDDATEAQSDAHDAAVRAAAGIAARLDEIDVELSRLRGRLKLVKDRRDLAGAAAASQIRAAIDDDVKDTRWEDVKGAFGDVWRAVDRFIDEHIEVILKIVEVLSYIATALALLALFIPGINILVVAIAAGVVLLSKTLLYATGNGSLADVLLAGFALVTLGTGKLATVVLGRASRAVRAAAAPRAGAAAARGAKAETQAARAALGRRLGRNLTPAQRAQARAELDALQRGTAREATRRSAQAADDVVKAPLAPATRSQGARSGYDMDNARYANDIARTRAQFPDLGPVGRSAGPAMTTARGVFGAGAVADVGDTAAGKSDIFGGKPYSERWERAKADFGS